MTPEPQETWCEECEADTETVEKFDLDVCEVCSYVKG